MCIVYVCVCLYIYIYKQNETVYPQESTMYMDKGRRKEILFPILQMGHSITCRYCDRVHEVIARTWSVVLVSALLWSMR